METEYLDIVNKEILEIELFFKELYNSSSSPSSSILPQTYTPRLLPFLRLESISSQTGQDSSSFVSLTSSEADGEAEERFVADLRERYKQLKVVQDQLHIELTRLRIWKLTAQIPQYAHGNNNPEIVPKGLKSTLAEPATGWMRKSLSSTSVSTQTFKGFFSTYFLGFVFIVLTIVLLDCTLNSVDPRFTQINPPMEPPRAHPWPRR
ncbi:hypothetical protein BGZ46_001272 [Entomortierella lignicola]|nr:hypothetical protein BGZ46_001272 [Entomortierella lignicola]